MTDLRPAAPFSLWERTLAFRYLRNKRQNGGVALISIISFVAITLAVAVLIIVMSVMNGFREQLLSRMLGFNPHAYVTGEALYDVPNRTLTVARLRAVKEVERVTPLIETQTLIQGTGPFMGAIVRGVMPEDLRDTPLIAGNIKAGTLSDFGAGEEGGDLIAVGDRMAALAGVSVGDPLVVFSPSGNVTAFGGMPRKKTYYVGAIFSVGMAEYDQNFIYMPMAQAQPLFGMGSDITAIEIRMKDVDRLDQTLPALIKAAGPGNEVTDWRDRNASFWGALQVERNVMRLILMLIIGIAALNIISGLVMLVKNKGRDIAILRTMGASQGAITRIFFMSGAAVGVLATPAGLILGVLFCVYIEPIQNFVDWVFRTEVFNADVYFLTSLPAKIDWSEVAIVTFWTLFMSCVTTIWPAWRASKIDPVEALRYE